MIHIPAKLTTSARTLGLGAIIATGATVALGAAEPALAASPPSPPTLAVSFTPNEIGVNGATTVAYTITNPNSSGSLTNVGFSDTLPTNTVIDNPDNVSTSGCGTGTTVNAGPGWASTSTSGITVKAGTPCVVDISLVATGAGNLSDTPGALTYSPTSGAASQSAPATNVSAASLDVLAPPTATIVTPVKNARYRYGAVVRARFSCSAATDANGSTLSGCVGSDDLGDSLAPGQRLNTTSPGRHTLDVQALDTIGDSTDTTVSYTVLADNVVGVRSLRPGAHGRLSLSLQIPGPGSLSVEETHGRQVLAHRSEHLGAARHDLALALAPTPAEAALIAKSPHGLAVSLQIVFAPKGGVAGHLSRRVILR